MSFGAGMGAGIGCGVAIGISTAKKQTCQQIREYVESNAIRIQDASGAEVDIDTLLARAVTDRSMADGKKAALVILLLLGFVVLAVLAYRFFA